MIDKKTLMEIIATEGVEANHEAQAIHGSRVGKSGWIEVKNPKDIPKVTRYVRHKVIEEPNMTTTLLPDAYLPL
jgi:hypothetical protein